MKLIPRQVGHRSQVRIPDHIQVRKPRQAQRLGKSTPTRGLDIEDAVGCVLRSLVQLVCQKERTDERGLVLAAPSEAVIAFIGRVKRRMRLKDNVRLAGYQVPRRVWMREHRRCALACHTLTGYVLRV